MSINRTLILLPCFKDDSACDPLFFEHEKASTSAISMLKRKISHDAILVPTPPGGGNQPELEYSPNI